jgi:type III secretion protein J
MRCAGVLGIVVCLASGCAREVAQGLAPGDAQEAVAALGAAGVPATRRATADRGEVVEVPAGEEPRAAAVLRAEGLPRGRKAGFAALAAGAGLVPTAAEDDARWLAALGGEIASHLLHLDGVADASVIATRPPTDPLAPAGDGRARATASVLLVVKAGATPSWAPADVQRLVAAAAGARPEDVTVVVARAPAAPTAAPPFAELGPLVVARSSRDLVLGLLGGGALLLLGLAVWILVLERRRARERAEAEPRGRRASDKIAGG